MAEDFRDYVNPHPACSEQVQRQTIGPGGEVYVEDHSAEVIHALIRSVRKGRRSVVRVMWTFNLAPVNASTRAKRTETIRALNAIHDRGGYVLEMATGERSDKHMASMVRRASEMIGRHGRGAAGKSKRGRPKLVRSASEQSAMKAAWFRRNTTINDVLDILYTEHDIETNKNELYRLFGPRG